MVRGIRFVREWRGKIGRNDLRDIDMTMGQRELLIQRGFAEWDDEEKPPANSKPIRRTQRESVSDPV